MIGRSNTRRLGALLLLCALVLPVVISIPSGSVGGITRGAGVDIEVTSITSHLEGEVIGFGQQAFTGLISNSGTEDYIGDVNVTLSINYPGNETENMTLVHTETVNLGNGLGNVGNQTLATFLPWMPTEEGYYLIKIEAMVTDDHPGNDSKEIMILALSSKIEGVKVSFGPGSPSNQKVKLGENTQMLGYSPYTFKVENTGIFNDTYNITIDSAWVMEGWLNQTRELAPGEFQLMDVHVSVPIDANPLSFDTMEFKATSTKNGSVFDTQTANTSIPNKEGVEVTVISQDPQVGYPGGPDIKFKFRITNTGDYPTIYTLSVSSSFPNWKSGLNNDVIQTPTIPIDTYVDRTAWISVPELVYETMEEDRTIEGETGSLILTATSPNGVADSGVGTVVVGLVHTVQMEVDPSNITIPFKENSKTSPQILNISVRIRSINNNKADPGADLDVNLSTPSGPDGVLFKPIWLLTDDENSSKTWTAVPPAGMIKLRSGEWSEGQHIKVIVPPFPFQGTATVVIQANPLLIEGRQGLTISATEEIKIHIGEYLNYSIVPPETEFFNDANLTADDDINMNGIEDWREGSPGETLYLPFNITNYGNGWDRYEIVGDALPIHPATLLPDDWELIFKPITLWRIPFNFDPGSPMHSTLVWVEIRIPDGAPIGESATIRIGAASSTEFGRDPDNPKYQWAEIDIMVLQGYGIDLEPEESAKSAQPLETVVYRLNVTNIGNGNDVIKFSLESFDLMGWTISFDNDQFNMTPGDRRTITIRVTPNTDAVRDDILALKVRAQSGRSISTFDEVWINTTVKYLGGVSLELLDTPSLIWRYPGETASFKLRAYNIGNGNDTFDLVVDPENQAWIATIGTSSSQGMSADLEIPIGGSEDFWVNISLPQLELLRNREELIEQGIQALNQVSTILSVTPKNYLTRTENINLTVGVLQDFKASIIPVPGEMTRKDVLVGEEVIFNLIIENRGNGPDDISAIPSTPGGATTHLSWTKIEGGPFEMDPFSKEFVNVSISPFITDRPQFHELIMINVEAVAGDELTYMTVNLTAEIVMSRILSESIEVDLGTMDNIIVKICNMPDPGTVPILELPYQRTYLINSTLDTDGTFSYGWSLPQPEIEVILTDIYQLVEIEIPVVAPSDLVSNSLNAVMDIDVIGGLDKMETGLAFLKAVYFDVMIDETLTRFENLYEGEEGRAFVTLITTGNRGQDTIPILIRIDDEVIGTFDAGPAEPQNFVGGLEGGGGEQNRLFQFEFDIPGLKWYEKGKEMELEIIIDPDDVIVENTPQGREISESNNMVTSSFTIKNYVPPLAIWILSLLLLIFMMIGGFVGYFFLKRRDSWFLLPLSIGAAGGFGMMFYVPLEDAMSIAAANRVGLAIILIDLLFIIPIMIYFFTRSGDSFILHQINKNRKEAPIEVGESTSTIWKPVSISLVGGLLMVAIPMLYWVIPSEMDGGLKSVIDSMVDLNAGIPVIVLIMIVPVISIGLQMSLLIAKKRSLTRISRTRDNLERLRTEIEEGFQ